MSTLALLASRITVHLRRFEADPSINVYNERAMTWPFRSPRAGRCGARVEVTRHHAVPGEKLSRETAEAYLAWLDAGNVGDVAAWRRTVPA